MALPSDEAEWSAYARHYHVDYNSSIHDWKGQLSSASDMPHAQFCLLRVLWLEVPGRKQTEQVLAEWLDQDIFTSARKRIRDYGKEWDQYLRNLPSKRQTRSEAVSDIGRFTHVRWSQLLLQGDCPVTAADQNLALYALAEGRTTRNRSRGYRQLADYPKFIATPVRGVVKEKDLDYDDDDESGDYEIQANITKDEQLITSFRKELIDQMQLTMFGMQSINHSVERTTFHLGRLFSAAVDGTDRFTNHPDHFKAIYEDKRFLRLDSANQIQMQESAEMACWISSTSSSHPTGVTGMKDDQGRRTYSRVLISLDRHEFWIILAVYDDRYVSYLRHEETLQTLGDASGDRIFLTMKQCGPFNIYDSKDMEAFGLDYIALVQQWRRGYGGNPGGGVQWMPYNRSERLALLKLDKSRSASGRKKHEEREAEDRRKKKAAREARAKSRERREQEDRNAEAATSAARTAAMAIDMSHLRLDGPSTPTPAHREQRKKK